MPFIGAGASMAVEWEQSGEKKRGPSWEELVTQATQLMGFSDAALARARGTDLQILEYFKRKNNQETARLTNWLAKLMSPSDDAIKQSKIHFELSQLDKCGLFYTTNFDDFLERSFKLHGRVHHVSAFEAEMGSRGACEIIKFHGDLDHPSEIVLTESDYEQRLRLCTPMDLRLRSDLLGRVVLFLGYSFRDQNVSYLFRLFMDDREGKIGNLAGDRAYIAVADPSDFEFELFAARKIRVIPIRRESQADDIAILLQELRS